MDVRLPDGFTARSAAKDDLSAVVDLMNAVTQADAGRSDASTFSVGRYWESGDLDLKTDTVLAIAPDGSFAGFAQFMEETPPAPYDVEVWISPKYAGSETGESLLDWIDRRAGDALSRAPAGVQVSIEHFPVYAGNERARNRLEKAGYSCERVFHRMTIEFDRPPDNPVLPEGIAIRPFRRGVDDKALHEAFSEAQSDEWGQENPLPFEKWRYYFIEAEESFDPGAWFLAAEGETIVGYALCRWDRAGEPDKSTVRYLGVRRDWRKRGIASALLLAAFGGIYRHGKRGAGLAVDATSYTGADRLYVRAGMHREAETLRYVKVLRRA